MSLKDQPAFPTADPNQWSPPTLNPGMTLRQYYAGLAMQGLIAAGDRRVSDKYDMVPMPALAEEAVQLADALIAELEKEFAS